MGLAERRNKDKKMASDMKAAGIERRSGKCPICYEFIPNDTFGGTGAAAHLVKCVRPAPKSRKVQK